MTLTRSRLLAILTAAVALVSALLRLHPESETDPMWHLMLARAVLQARSRVVPEPAALPDFTDPAFVPEWLWGVLMLGAHHVGAWAAVAVLVAVVTAATVVLLGRLLDRSEPGASPGAIAGVLGVVMVVVLQRLRARPESAGLLLLPAFVLLASSYREASGRRRLGLGLGLVGLEVVWAQCHGSFVLALPVFAVLAAPGAWRRPDALTLRADLATLALLTLGLGTSAYGFGLPAYLGSHALGESKQYIHEMARPTLAHLDVLDRGPGLAVYVALWVLCAVGLAAGRRVPWRWLALALVGVPLVATAIRFTTPGVILLAPLAITSAHALGQRLPAGRASGALGPAVAAASLAFSAWFTHVHAGPLGRLGLLDGAYPVAAAALVRGLGPGVRVLSSFDVGGPFGLWLGGQARTYVDSRTPLYFDDTDYGVSRDVLKHGPAALARGLRRYGADALVVRRPATCAASVPAGWAPAVLDPMFTTFRPAAAGPALRALSPCGPDYLTAAACDDGARALDDEIARHEALGASAFTRYLRAERILRCGGDLNTAGDLLPGEADAQVYRAPWARSRAVYLLARGDVAAAAEVLGPNLRAGDRRSITLLAPAIEQGALPAAEARSLLEAGIESQGDATHPDARALLGLVCQRQGDADCVRHQGLRAAAGGSPHARPLLDWIAARHPSARARQDAVRWREVLDAAGTPPADRAPESKAPESEP